jgi:hypothetical protein
MIERDSTLKPEMIHEILTSTAKPLGPNGHNDELGWGLVDPTRALLEVDAQVADDARNPGKPMRPGPISSR